VVGTTTVTATFSENVTGVSGTTFTVKTAAGAAVTGTVAYNATTRVATFTPTAAMANDTRYNIALTTAIKDAAGNALVATTAQPLTWTFLTGPRPTLTARTPAVNATAVPKGNDITATFSELVQGVSTTSFKVQSVSSTGTLGTAVAAVVSQSTTNANQWILNPSATLAANTKYRVTLTSSGSAIRDMVNNNMASAATTWDFTTGA